MRTRSKPAERISTMEYYRAETAEELAKAIADGWEIKTANGGEVRIYCTDGGGAFPIHGAVQAEESGPWSVREWTAEGQYEKNGSSDLDLVIESRTIELDLWLNVYRCGVICEHKTKEQADKEASKTRFACINLKRPVREGEGL